MPKNLVLPKLKPRQTQGLVIRISRNKTAAMMLLMEHAVRGYTFWTRGKIPYEKALVLAHKFDELYGISATPAQRAYRKKKGLANTHLVMYPDDDGKHILWWLQATQGTGKVHEREKLLNCRERNQRLQWTHQYQLAYRQRNRLRGGGATWSWWLQDQYRREWEVAIIHAASRHGIRSTSHCKDNNSTKLRMKPDEGKERTDDLLGLLTAIKRIPMFGGARSQVQRILTRADKVWRRSHGATPPFDVNERLPWLGQKLPIYDNPPLTLDILVMELKRNAAKSMNEALTTAR